MRLGQLLAGEELHGTPDPDPPVTGFAIDHRKVAPGNVFGAFAGGRVDGASFIPAAVAAGAIAVVAAPSEHVSGAVHIADVAPRRVFAALAARYFAPFPPTVVAVTGTNGKTSTVELTRQLWRMAGFNAASIGTLGVTTADERVTTGLTTPDVVTFLSNAAGLAREGISHLAFEASSHGLSQHRTDGVAIAAAAFTNFSRDHLDYHRDMASYLAAKTRLFGDILGPDGTAVIWTDDPAAASVVDAAQQRGARVMSVGTVAGSGGRSQNGAGLMLVEREPGLLGQRLVIETRGERTAIMLPLIGAYQAANALVAAGLVVATGGDPAATLAALARLQPVRGRLERAAITRSGAPIYVDYAHSAAALCAAIDALKPHAQRRLIVVFGAGGDRDRGKRAAMGAVAASMADRVIVTDDNPRSEDAATIRAMIMASAPGASEIPDRAEAIAAAIADASGDDIVLIAGKGHEQGQIVGDLVLPFDDVATARACATGRPVGSAAGRAVSASTGHDAAGAR